MGSATPGQPARPLARPLGLRVGRLYNRPAGRTECNGGSGGTKGQIVGGMGERGAWQHILARNKLCKVRIMQSSREQLAASFCLGTF